MAKIKAPKDNIGRLIRTHASSNQTFDTMPPLFCFRHMVAGYCVQSCTPEQKAALADALYDRSRLTWGQLRQAGRRGLGYEQLTPKKDLPPTVKEDVNIIGFRFWNRARMVGFRDGNVFHIIWLDLRMNLYDHE